MLMFKEKKLTTFVLFQLFQPLDLQPVAFKTLVHSIFYKYTNPSTGLAKKKKKKALSTTVYMVRFRENTSLMKFKALL